MSPAKETPDTFAEALVKVQGEIKSAIKDSTNPAFRSKYADLGAVWEAVKPALQNHGIAVIQTPNFSEAEGMWLETKILHVSGESMMGRYPLRPVKQDPQGFGSALTYARRYSLASMLGVVADEDDDGNAASAPARRAAQQAPEAPKNPQVAEPEPDDQDTRNGVANWCAQQKELISECVVIIELTSWLDKNGGDWVSPASQSALHRLKKAAPAAYNDLKTYYMAKLEKV